MGNRQDRSSLEASLGTEFRYERDLDLVTIVAPDGTEVVVPGPDLRQLTELLGAPQQPLDSAYGVVLDTVRQKIEHLQVQVDRETAEAPRRLTKLLAMESDARLAAVQEDRSLRTYGVASLALERARRLVLDDARVAGDLASLGFVVADYLDPRVYGGSQVRDLQGYALAVLANTFRCRGDLKEAQRLFRMARERLALGTDASIEELETDRLESSLHRDLRDFPRALELLARVEEGYRGLDQSDDVAQAVQKKALVLDEMGDLEGARELYREAARAAEGSQDGLLRISIGHGLVVVLNRLGRSREAAELFESLQPLYRENYSTLLETRRLWTAGTIALDLGDLPGAVEKIEEARSRFEREGYPFESALASLDLAAALVGLGRLEDAKRLAASTYAYMSSQQIHPDMLAALAVFQQAAAREELSRDVLRRIGRQLKRAPAVAPLPS